MEKNAVKRVKQRGREGIDPNRDFFKTMKWLVRTLYREDGSPSSEQDITKESHFYRMSETAPEQFKLLKEVITYYLKEDTSEPVVKAWLLKGNSMSQGEFAKQSGLKENTFYVKLRRSKEKFMMVFGEQCLYELSDSNGSQKKTGRFLSDEELEQYRKRLITQRNDLRSLQNNLLVKLDEYRDDDIPYMESEEFNGLCVELWGKVSRPVTDELINRCHDKGLFGYINHLMKAFSKTEKEWKDFHQIVRMIEGNPPLMDSKKEEE